jgi:hypothetical protein
MEKWILMNYTQSYIYAMAYAELGETDKAFERLEEAYEIRLRTVTTIGVEPLMDSLRSDPRFDELLIKIGLN